MKHNKLIGLLILLVVYLFAFAVGIASYSLLINFVDHPLLAVLLADIAATIFVWGCGVILKTASVYDPYWSVQPPLILLCVLIEFGVWDAGAILLLAAVSIWSFRLTANFISTFSDLSYQDWRYSMLKDKAGKYYQLINLFGICLFPTIVVFSCTFPMLQYVVNGGSAFNSIALIGFSLIIVAIAFETVADIQMHSFRKSAHGKGEIIRIGLWKHNRHPNYFGEMLMWWGVYAVVTAINPTLWFTFFGALINTVMFLAISIPMAERRLASYKKDFLHYRDETWMFLPIPFPKQNRESD